MKIKIKKGKSFFIASVKKVSLFGKFIGLMFKSNKYDILLFDFKYDDKHAIHSFFVFFDFLAVWLDKNDNAVDFFVVKPFSTIKMPKIKCRKLVEVPFNSENKRLIEFFVGKRKI